MGIKARIQGEQPLIPQVDVGPRLGGVKSVLNRLQGYVGVVSRTMIAAMFYQSLELWTFTPNVPIVDIQLPIGPLLMPNMAIYLVWCVLGAAALGAFDIRYVFGSEKQFHNLAAERAERSPIKQDTEAIRRQIDEQLAVADGGTTVVVPECTNCGEAGQPGTHKDASVIECPDCGDILFRRLA